MPTDDEIVVAAVEAAENVVFSRLSKSDLDDYDVTVSFAERVLSVDVYLEAPDADVDADRVADDAALAARAAVDDLLREEE